MVVFAAVSQAQLAVANRLMSALTAAVLNLQGVDIGQQQRRRQVRLAKCVEKSDIQLSAVKQQHSTGGGLEQRLQHLRRGFTAYPVAIAQLMDNGTFAYQRFSA